MNYSYTLYLPTIQILPRILSKQINYSLVAFYLPNVGPIDSFKKGTYLDSTYCDAKNIVLIEINKLLFGYIVPRYLVSTNCDGKKPVGTYVTNTQVLNYFSQNNFISNVVVIPTYVVFKKKTVGTYVTNTQELNYFQQNCCDKLVIFPEIIYQLLRGD